MAPTKQKPKDPPVTPEPTELNADGLPAGQEIESSELLRILAEQRNKGE